MANPTGIEGISTESTGKGQSGSTFSLDYGRRPMKSYPITDGELSQLAGLGYMATICFSVASGLLVFALDLSKDISMSQELSEATKVFWDTINIVSYSFSGFLFILGGGLIWKRQSKVSEIKDETKFGVDDVTR